MSPVEKTKNTDISVEEYNKSRRSGCRHVVNEGAYGRRICNQIIYNRLLHLCQDHDTTRNNVMEARL